MLQSNWENQEHQRYFWNVIVLHENLTAWKNVNYFGVFVAGSHFLIFAAISHNTVNIPEIFQVFTVFPIAL